MAAPVEEAPAEPTLDDEFPADDVFNRLSGQERASHWQNARQRIADLNAKIAEADKSNSFVQEYGGREQVEAQLGLLNSIFSPVTDEQGNPVLSEDGLPETTTSPWWQVLRERSPQTFVRMGEDWLYEEHSPGVQNWQVMFEHVFGLNPQLLDTYRSIHSPADAVQYQPAGEISAYELEGVPQELHDAYRATDPEMRQRLQEWDVPERDRYLREKQTFLEERRAREMRDSQFQEYQQTQQQENERRMASEAFNHALQIRQGHRQALKEELARNFSPTADPAANDEILEDCLNLTDYWANNNPEIAPLIQNADRYYRLAYILKQPGVNQDFTRAAQAESEANSAAARALGMARRFLQKKIQAQSARASAGREGWDREREQARGRAVVPRSEAGGLAGGGFTSPSTRPAFTEGRYDEIARSLTRNGGGFSG